ncbi:MAG: hypothetical protein L6V93_06130 [Clostridiales bacterium]|nr:MAG: hypothetical protein L6V93_06130 [Clostridiales bacterium]
MVRNYINTGVAMFVFSKKYGFILTEKSAVRTKLHTVVMLALGFLLSLIYIQINSFGFIESIYILANDQSINSILSPAEKHSFGIVKAYNTLFFWEFRALWLTL